MLEPPPEGTFDIEDRNLPIKYTAKDSTPVETPLLTEEVVPTDSDAPKKGKGLVLLLRDMAMLLLRVWLKWVQLMKFYLHWRVVVQGQFYLQMR
ncbi:uncharacterized protein LOC114277942 isoform X2 [Camellia sinensis]|uniref:uncharacterized protein LOC114277942 isoform X2 n=1 Tax=Camellia sinensis TaxID=4442 RepID=UPI001036A3D9|nr:uncharacterized protein LOC114277942 isoform X2 [Camellia sinensis]